MTRSSRPHSTCFSRSRSLPGFGEPHTTSVRGSRDASHRAAELGAAFPQAPEKTYAKAGPVPEPSGPHLAQVSAKTAAVGIRQQYPVVVETNALGGWKGIFSGKTP